MNVLLSWSGGKDSMMALHQLVEDQARPISLLTTFSGEFKRITMHGVRESLLDAQAKSLRIPVIKLFLPQQADMKTYNHEMHRVYSEAADSGMDTVAFGDIFLEDLRNYRERQVERAGLKSAFPVWGRNTTEFMNEFLDLGYRTLVVAVDGSKLDRSFAGRIIDREFLKDLPAHVDPCGENGEFHTFVVEGPLFDEPLIFRTGEVVERHYPSPSNKKELVTYYFQDMLPG